MAIYSFEPFGYEGSLVNVEIDIRKGIPALDVVGLADAATKETRERIRAAITNSGLEVPAERILMALSPADIRKDSAGHDLAMALAIVRPNLMNEHKGNVLVIGELQLDGSVRPVRGLYAAVSTAAASGITEVICPIASVSECCVEGVHFHAVNNLAEAVREADKLLGTWVDEKTSDSEKIGVKFPVYKKEENMDIPVGYDKYLRLLAIAIGGGHNVLFYGQPGCGKSMLMEWASCLQPLPTDEEIMSIRRIQSLAGLYPHNGEIKAPFRMPHQTATIEGICGGGPNCRPGEITLAHNGILFLDEAAEFRSSVLQMLRVPLETKAITLARAGRSTVFPANFQLFMATNPCPCGNFGSTDKICLCSAKSVEMYWRKFSAPLLDRFTIHCEVKNDGTRDTQYTVDSLREIVKTIRDASYARQGKKNEDLTPCEIAGLKISDDAKVCLDKLAASNGLSARAVSELTKLARSFADLRNGESILSCDVENAFEMTGKLPLSLGD